MAASRHIEARHFLQQLSSIFRDVRSNVSTYVRHTSPIRATVCVSGGPDSMALAYLLKQACHPSQPTTPAFDLRAIIVDHQARPKSSWEASLVQKYLSDLGVDSDIVQLNWPHGTSPLASHNFETEARRKRYEAIAKHALKAEAQAIFTGHHEDDQVETMLMRLTQIGEFRSLSSQVAMQGIAPISPVPCCEHLFGMQPTSAHPVFANNAFKTSSIIDDMSISRSGSRVDDLSFQPQLHRPLLSFSKQEILATCSHHRLPFVIDETNFDPTITPRNAIRYMLSTFALPRALNKGRLSKVRNTIRNHLNHVKIDSPGVAKLITVKPFSNQSLALSVEIPTYSVPHLHREFADSVSYALARITESISPAEHDKFPVTLSETTVARVLERSTTNVKPFNDHQVCFVPNGFTRPKTGIVCWTLYRQPMRAAEKLLNTTAFQFEEALPNGQQCSEWTLWDNRIWIRIKISTKFDIGNFGLKPYEKQDVHAVKENLSRQQSRVGHFESLIKAHAPGNLRFTLPVLTYQDRILAFPTFNFWIEKCSRDVTFELRYPCKTRVKEFFEDFQVASTKW